jgi:hypothetical protein
MASGLAGPIGGGQPHQLLIRHLGGLAGRLVVTMREQQGDTGQYGGTGEILI